MYHRNKRTALVALSIGAFVVTGCSSKQSVDAQSSATPVAAAVEPAVEMCCQVVANLYQTSGKETAA